MVSHLRGKYPGLSTPTIVLPIVEDLGANVSLERPVRDRLRVVYTGGLQHWQNVDRMLDVVAACGARCEFRFYTDSPDRLHDAARGRGVADRMQIATAPPEELPAIYGDADLGLVLRDDIAVNRVSCPTKLSEYLACGVVPVVDLAEIGDFAALGYAYVPVAELLEGRLPDAAALAEMRRRNRAVFERIQARFADGEAALRGRLPVRDGVTSLGVRAHTTLERAVFYPRRGTRLEIRRDDGWHDVPFDDVTQAQCHLDFELPGSGVLRAVRLRLGDPPYVTSPVEASVVDSHGRQAPLPLPGSYQVDRFGNWLFCSRGATCSAVGLEFADALRLVVRFEYLLIGPEAWVVGNVPRDLRAEALRRLARVPGARPMWAALQRLKRLAKRR
jgi:hypothetical protein